MTGALASAGVQYGTITVASGSTSGTASISAMGSGGFLLMDGQNASQAGASLAQSSCTLSISGTTITAARQTGGANTVTVPFVAVDGDTTNLIKSVQFGSVSFTGGSSTLNATISAVTTGNTAVAHLGVLGTSTSVSLNLTWPIWALASSTAVSMTTNTSGGTLTGRFCAIEFQSAALVSLQYAVDTNAPSATTRARTITAVTLANTLSIYAGQWSSSTTASSQVQYGQLTATTTLTIGTNSAGFVSISFASFIVNLNSALVETAAQRGLISQAAAASGTAAISSVNTAHAILSYMGQKTNGSNWNVITSSLSLTSSILVTANSGASTTNSTSYEVIALNSGSSPDVNVNVTAVAGTGAAGSPTVTGDAEADPTGVAGTGAAGDVTVTLQLNVPITGDPGTGQVGNPTVTGDANITPTGVTGTGNPGTPTVAIDVSTAPTGVAGTGQPGDVTVSITIDAEGDPVGVAATGSPGNPTATGDAEADPLGFSGTGAAGTPTVSLQLDVPVVGVEGDGSPGSVAVTIDANVTPLGVAGTGSPGAPIATGDAEADPAGVAGTGQPGSVTVTTVTPDVTVNISGVQAAGAAGDVTVTGDANVSITGVQGTGAAGDVTVQISAAQVDVSVNITGVEGDGFAGDVSVISEMNALRRKLGLPAKRTRDNIPAAKQSIDLDWDAIKKKRRQRLEQLLDETLRPEEVAARLAALKKADKIEHLPIDFDQVAEASKRNYNAELLLLSSSLPFWC
jgi:hypothetical protein